MATSFQERFKSGKFRVTDDSDIAATANLMVERGVSRIPRPSQVMLSPEAAAAIARTTGRRVSSRAYGGDVQIRKDLPGLSSKEGLTQNVADRLFKYNPGVVQGSEVKNLFGDNGAVKDEDTFYVPPDRLPAGAKSPNLQLPAGLLNKMTAPSERENMARRLLMTGGYDQAVAEQLLMSPDKTTTALKSSMDDITAAMQASAGPDIDLDATLAGLEKKASVFVGAATKFSNHAANYTGAWGAALRPEYRGLWAAASEVDSAVKANIARLKGLIAARDAAEKKGQLDVVQELENDSYPALSSSPSRRGEVDSYGAGASYRKTVGLEPMIPTSASVLTADASLRRRSVGWDYPARQDAAPQAQSLEDGWGASSAQSVIDKISAEIAAETDRVNAVLLDDAILRYLRSAWTPSGAPRIPGRGLRVTEQQFNRRNAEIDRIILESRRALSNR